MSVLRMLVVLLAIMALQSGPSRAQEKQEPGDAGSRLRLTLDFDALTDEWLDQQKIDSRTERELWKFVSGPFNRRIVDAARGENQYMVSIVFLHDDTLPERRLSLPAEDPDADPLALVAYTSLQSTIRQPEAVVTMFSVETPAEPRILLTAHLQYDAETAKWNSVQDRPGDGGETAAAETPPHLETVLIEGATYRMGTPIKDKGDPEYHSDEAPLQVTVKKFRIGRYPVTAEQMCAFLNSPEAQAHRRDTLYNHESLGPYNYSTITLADEGLYIPRRAAAKSPANQVTWQGAVLFCKWLSKRTGRIYRLPTEAEWELAARGKELRRWPWGNGAPTAEHGPRFDSDELLNSKQLAVRIQKNEPTWPTAGVGTHPANATPEGVHDMLAYIIGEWCANKYGPHPTAEEMMDPEMDPSDLTSERVVRGCFHRAHSRPPLLPLGQWPKHGGRTWTRCHAHPITAPRQAARYGFRVVEEVKSTNRVSRVRVRI